MNREKITEIIYKIGVIGMLIGSCYYAFFKNDYSHANFCLLLALGAENSYGKN